MKLRYVSRHEPFVDTVGSRKIYSGEVAEFPTKQASKLLERDPHIWFEESDKEGKDAQKRAEDMAAAKKAAEEALKAQEAAEKNKMQQQSKKNK
jgi:hypothetical protein